MKDCIRCDGAGVVQIVRPAPKTPFYKGVRHLPPRAELCQCVVAELGALRMALRAAGLVPAEHWKRELPGRSQPPELSVVLLSTRVDGYRVVSQYLEHHGGGASLVGLAPNGVGLLDGNGERLWWARVEDAEQSIDRNFPLPHEPEES